MPWRAGGLAEWKCTERAGSGSLLDRRSPANKAPLRSVSPSTEGRPPHLTGGGVRAEVRGGWLRSAGLEGRGRALWSRPRLCSSEGFMAFRALKQPLNKPLLGERGKLASGPERRATVLPSSTGAQSCYNDAKGRRAGCLVPPWPKGLRAPSAQCCWDRDRTGRSGW